MSIATAQNGDELLFFRPRMTMIDDYPALPMIFSCVIARYQGCTTFVFNPRGGEWELPNGRIEAGESAEEAGIRELYEESGQRITSLTHAGVALIRLHNGDLEPGHLFTVELDQIDPFIANDETSALMLWDMQHPVGGHVNEIALALAQLIST